MPVPAGPTGLGISASSSNPHANFPAMEQDGAQTQDPCERERKRHKAFQVAGNCDALPRRTCVLKLSQIAVINKYTVRTRFSVHSQIVETEKSRAEQTKTSKICIKRSI